MPAVVYKKAAVNTASSGDNTLVTAVANKKIRVHAAVLVAAGAVTVAWKSDNTAGGAETSLTGAQSLIAGTPYVLPFSEQGWVETVAGKLLNLELGGAVQVSGTILYSEV